MNIYFFQIDVLGFVGPFFENLPPRAKFGSEGTVLENICKIFKKSILENLFLSHFLKNFRLRRGFLSLHRCTNILTAD